MRNIRVRTMDPADIAQRMSVSMWQEALEAGMSVSAFFERLNPTDTTDLREGGLDAFGRVLQKMDIITRSVPEAGVYADKWEDVFDRTEAERLIGLEWVHRQWRKASFGGSPNTRDVFSSVDIAINAQLRPYAEAAGMRGARQLTPAIPLETLVAITTPITGDAYRATFLDTITDDQKRMVRVGEFAEIPRVTLKTKENTVRLFKYGRALESSYEALRRMRLDRVALQIGLMAIQTEVDKVVTALDVLVSGDGNSGTAATVYNLTTLDTGAVAGTLSLPGWISFKLKFANPYSLEVVLAQEIPARQALLLNTGSANILLQTVPGAPIGGFRPLNPQLSDTPGLGITADAPALKLVGIDGRFALERVTEVGSNITEVEKWATRQTQALVISEVEGYAVIDPAASKILNINA